MKSARFCTLANFLLTKTVKLFCEKSVVVPLSLYKCCLESFWKKISLGTSGKLSEFEVKPNIVFFLQTPCNAENMSASKPEQLTDDSQPLLRQNRISVLIQSVTLVNTLFPFLPLPVFPKTLPRPSAFIYLSESISCVTDYRMSSANKLKSSCRVKQAESCRISQLGSDLF